MSDQSDIAEIEWLYREHGPALVLFASAIAGESSRAQDVVQQVFLKLIRDGSLKGVTEKRAYVFACVRNTMLNEVKGRWRGVSLDPETAWFDPPMRDYAAESNLRQSLIALPEDQRQVVVLHVWGELTFLKSPTFSTSVRTLPPRVTAMPSLSCVTRCAGRRRRMRREKEKSRDRTRRGSRKKS